MSNSFTNRARLGLERLEAREVMSWTVPPAVLPAGGDHYTVIRTDNDGVYRDNDYITRGEVDSYKFVAQRSGTYTFEAGKTSNSRIDTVIALYDSGNHRLAYNDDISNTVTDSRMKVNLVAGRTYTFAVSNFRNSANGHYYVRFTPPSLNVSATTDVGAIMAQGSATLHGTTLTLNLYGQTHTNFDRTIDYITVRLYDVNHHQIGTGAWYRSFGTAGTFVPSDPVSHNQSWDVDLSGWDLSRASYLTIEVGYNGY